MIVRICISLICWAIATYFVVSFRQNKTEKRGAGVIFGIVLLYLLGSAFMFQAFIKP